MDPVKNILTKMNRLHDAARAAGSAAPACSVPSRRNPVRLLNDALHEYRTQHTTMSKDEFYERGCYQAFMWAWQHSSSQNTQAQGRPPLGEDVP